MGCYSKVVLFPNPALNGPDFIICKLNNPATADTSEVAVMFVAIDVLIVKVSVLKIDLLNQSTVDEEGDGPVEGGLGNPLLLVPQPQKELIDIEVIVDREDLIDNHLPFRRVAEPLFLDVFAKLLDGIHDHTLLLRFNYNNSLFMRLCQVLFCCPARSVVGDLVITAEVSS
jgi:hypothetical protein